MTDFIEQKQEDNQDSIKVSKNSRGYTWEIKRYFREATTNASEVIKWIEAVDMKLSATFEKKSEEDATQE